MPLTQILLDTFTLAARVAYPYVHRMVVEGLSANAIQELLPSLTGGVRRTDLLSMIRGIKDVLASGPALAALGDHEFFNPEALPPPVTTTLRRFSFQFEVSGTLAETGELDTVNVTLSTDSLLSMGVMKQQVLDMVGDAQLPGCRYVGAIQFDPRQAVPVSGSALF